MKVNFASDNFAGIDQKILYAIQKANHGPAKAYGQDEQTKIATEIFTKTLGENADVYFVFNGTAANVLSLSCILKPFQSIIASKEAHIHVDECGAIEKYSGSKILLIEDENGKIKIDKLQQFLGDTNNQHRTQPKVISITQSTELGTVYTIDEIKAITHFAHKNNMYVHVDGARLSNAIASLDTDLQTMICKTGIDVVTLGGTKNGMLLGEAVIFLDKKLSENFKYIRKQSMQLASKMRFISAQFIEYLTDDLYLKNGKHANKMAQLLKNELETIGLSVSRPTQANAVFVHIPPNIAHTLQEKYDFYIWSKLTSEARLMTSFNTTEEEIKALIDDLKSLFINA